MTDTVPTPATQVKRPWHATLRTFLQTAFGGAVTLGLVVPPIVEIVLDEAGQTMPGNLRGYLLGAAGVVAAVSAAATRIMAIPAVEAWLQRKAPAVSAAGTPIVVPAPEHAAE